MKKVEQELYELYLKYKDFDFINYYNSVFKTNTTNSISKINVLYLRNAIHPLPKVLTILTNSTLHQYHKTFAPIHYLLFLPQNKLLCFFIIDYFNSKI